MNRDDKKAYQYYIPFSGLKVRVNYNSRPTKLSKKGRTAISAT